ncbi:hypothetical protein BDY17DRAFT_16611 [Neohortaea acidophila]|uniref:Uncharacterized protein n=1 Tax=Neohortaea acidophila TaxID=245834 RepID=A0A6A6Q8I8_9PEZI|nr:uncharacterized protein BDY17DRAFT_16611 [Neohortaea acidophila]KAF2487687.1 hypothetical protein BDY17DRAFT_16611 [Neohortaea acidophila]
MFRTFSWRGGVMATRCFPVAKTVGSSPILVVNLLGVVFFFDVSAWLGFLHFFHFGEAFAQVQVSGHTLWAERHKLSAASTIPTISTSLHDADAANSSENPSSFTSRLLRGQYYWHSITCGMRFITACSSGLPNQNRKLLSRLLGYQSVAPATAHHPGPERQKESKTH